MKLLFAADLHLGKPFTATKAQGAYQSDSIEQALGNCVEYAITNKADAVLFAGDVIDLDCNMLHARLKFVDYTRKLTANNIAVFIINGNHDPLSGAEWKGLPEGCYCFGSEPSSHRIATASGQTLNVTGCSHSSKAITKNLALTYPAAREADVKVAMLHCNVGGMTEHDNYAPCQLNDLLGKGYDIWHLGHVHSYKLLNPTAPAVFYTGSLQGLSIRETEAHGAVWVDTDSGSWQPQFVPLDAVRWCSAEVDLTDVQTEADMLAKFDALRQSLMDSAVPVIARVSLTGRTLMNAELKKSGLNELFPTDDENFIIESIRDNTLPVTDPEQYAELESVSGEVVRLSRQWAEDPAKVAQLTKELNEVISKYHYSLSDDEIRRALIDAGVDALSVLSGEGE